MTEARSKVLAALDAAEGRDLSIDRLRALSKTTYGSARATWLAVCEPDLER